MLLNENSVKEKWPKIRDDIQKSWNKLTAAELDKTNGDKHAISGLVQDRYGKTKEGYDKRIADIFQRFEDDKRKPNDRMKKN